MRYMTPCEFNQAQQLLGETRYNRPSPEMSPLERAAFGLGITKSVDREQYQNMHAVVCGYAYVIHDPLSPLPERRSMKPNISRKLLMVLMMAVCCSLPGFTSSIALGLLGGFIGAVIMLCLVLVAASAPAEVEKTEDTWHPVPRDASCLCADCKQRYGISVET